MRKAPFLLLALLLMPVIPVPTAHAALPPFPMRVGYSAEKMFDASAGLPVFVPGETMWVYPGEPVIISISGPNGRPVAAIPLGEHPFPLYRFKESDRLGTWLLRIESGKGQFTFPIELSEQSIRPDSNNVKFSLAGDSLAIQGVMNLSPPDLPSSTDILLARKGKNESEINIATNITIAGSQIVLKIVKKEGDSSTIRIAPYAPLLVSEYEADAPNAGPVYTTWAEITTEVPLTKRTGRSLIVTYIDGAMAKTPRVATQLSGHPELLLTMRIPPKGIIEDPTTVPMKFGRASLNVYIQQATTINLVQIPVVLMPKRVIIQPAATFTATPFQQQLNYEFRDILGDLTSYEIILATKINGLDSVWSTPVTPPLGSLRVINQIGGDAVVNYDINFTSGVIARTKVGERTYMLLSERRLTTPYTLAIDGIMQKEGEYQPATVTLSQLNEVSVFANQGKVSFKIMGGLGIPAPEGNLTVYRVTGDSLRVIKELIWPGGGSVNTTLPQGTYRATARILNQEQSRDFEIRKPDTFVDIQMQELFTRDDMYLTGATVIVIAVELGFAIMVWRRALRVK